MKTKEVRITESDIHTAPPGFAQAHIRRKLIEGGIDITKEYSCHYDIQSGDKVYTQKEESEK